MMHVAMNTNLLNMDHQQTQAEALNAQEKCANAHDSHLGINGARTFVACPTNVEIGNNVSTSDGSDRHLNIKSFVSVDCKSSLKQEGKEGAKGLMGLREMYEHEGDWEDDDEDDDWQPEIFFPPLVRWSCINCTMPNFEEELRCQLCGEHQKSAILTYGHLAPRDVPENINESHSELKELPQKGSMENTSVSTEFTALLVSQSKRTGCTILGFDERMLLHAEVEKKLCPHPERPDRLRSILGGLTASGLLSSDCVVIPGREATREELEAVHTDIHVDAVEATASVDPSAEARCFTSDTYTNQHSALAARIAAGICIDIVRMILKGQAANGFALVRPPGHHAESSTVMGFCLHNNAAIAVRAAQAMGAKRVLIIDWDVHHGNGIQEIFEDDASVLYISLHRHERGNFYPGTGAASEVGRNEGEGFSVNIPWSQGGVGDEDYLFAFEQIVMPIASQFKPDITIVSAGFDAANGDPLGGCKVSPLGYAQMTYMLSSLANGRMLVVLEGGYNLRSISASAVAVMKVLLGEVPTDLHISSQPTKVGVMAVLEVCKIHGRYWKFPESLLTLSSEFLAPKLKGKQRRRRVTGGPVWWKWGRKRLVYKHWFS